MIKKKATKVLTRAYFIGCTLKNGTKMLIVAKDDDGRVATIETSLLLKDRDGEVIMTSANEEGGWLFQAGTCCTRVANEISKSDCIIVDHDRKDTYVRISARLTQSLGRGLCGGRREFNFNASYKINNQDFQRFFIEELEEFDY